MHVKHLKHLLVSKWADRIHSPFVFDIYYYLLKGKEIPYCSKIIKQTFKLNGIDLLIGHCIFKLWHKLKPKTALCISNKPMANCLFITNAYKCKIDLLGDTEIPKELIDQVQKIPSITKNKYDSVLIDINDTDLENLEFKKFEFILITHIHTDKKQAFTWGKIRNNTLHNVCLDFFYFGISFQRPNQADEYFRLRF